MKNKLKRSEFTTYLMFKIITMQTAFSVAEQEGIIVSDMPGLLREIAEDIEREEKKYFDAQS